MQGTIYGIFLLCALGARIVLNNPIGRCGTDDRSNPASLRDKKWNQRTLTYRILNYPRTLNQSTVRRVLKESLDKWSVITDTTFQENKAAPSNIKISFVRGNHGDEKDFDGSGGVLAHAYFPDTPREGQVHFDSDESWTVGSGTGTDLASVSLHEFGHTLGLEHSDVPDSVMYPWFQGYTELRREDVNAARALYGTSDSEETAPNICSTDFDAAAIIRGKFYFFKDAWFALYRGARSTKFVGIDGYWHGLPARLDRVDALYERDSTDGNVVVFNGRNYWVLKNNREAVDCPVYGCNITDFGIPDTVERIDAAFQWRSHTYIIGGNDYWRFDEKKGKLVPGYPRTIFSLFSIPPPAPIDAVLTLRYGAVLVLKRSKIYHYDDPTRSIPYDARNEWFYCEEDLRVENIAQALYSFSKFTISLWSVFIFLYFSH